MAHDAQEVNMQPKQKQGRSERIALNLTPEEIERIDDWGFAQRIRARSEVIRTLALKQLDQEIQERA